MDAFFDISMPVPSETETTQVLAEHVTTISARLRVDTSCTEHAAAIYLRYNPPLHFATLRSSQEGR
ncbi:hypothetical protein FOMPIDRAFT_1061639 [Fomitopsis schrenkii]|uniref:Uncharacterized protein n=1 Tax=Fomitopsis schrenkii TaxID=2126942 RepID=S8FHR2_FOMSC|nr:hypothetical protein FOMPIDRAFT_1061639 [Fomitopsis schrenkii]